MATEKTSSWSDLLKSFWYFLGKARLRFITWNILNTLAHANGLIMPFIVGLIINFFTEYTAGDSLTPFYWYCAIITFSMVSLSVLRLSAKRKISQAGIDMQHQVKVEGFGRLMAFSMKWHDNESTGNKVEKINRGAEGFNRITGIIKDQLSSILLMFIGALGVFAIINYHFLLFFTVYMFIFFIIASHYDRQLVTLTNERNKIQEKASGTYFEGANNILSVKSLGAHKSLNTVIEKSETENRKYAMLIRDNKTGRMRSVQILNGIALGIYFLLVGNGVLNGSLSVGFIATAFSYFSSISGSMFRLTGILPELIEQRSAISRLMPIFTTAEDRYFGEAKFPRQWKTLSFEEASFSHGSKDTLTNLDITIHKNEKIGIIGASGSGKSTFGQLLIGLHPIKKGRLTIGGKDFYDISHEEVLKKITPVMQETELFNMSLKENITLFKSVDKQTFKQAIEISQLQPIIDNLPKGLDTLIGEKGYKLSGGERQRVGIARAICKNPSILILDEATSALDSKTELKIQRGIETLKNKTILIIAHRLSTLEKVDRIVVFDKGKIIEQGKFKELIKNKKSRFYKLWTQQKKGP